MKLINKNTDYAVRALLYIGRSGQKIVSTTQLEQELKLPRPFLRKILQSLQKANILRSVKGNKGGFMLKRSLDKVFLTDVIKVFQGDISLTDCIIKKRICPDVKTCLIRKKVKSLEKFIVNDLEKTTIASLSRD